MFGTFKLCAPVMLMASVAVAITIDAPEVEPASGGPTTIKWTPDSQDDFTEFSIELTHPDFNDAMAIANSVDPATGSITVNLPIIPAAGDYTLKFVNVTDINDVFAESAPFSVAAPVSTSESTTASATGSRTASGASAIATTPISGSLSASVHSASMSVSASASAKSAGASANASSAVHALGAVGPALTCTAAVLLGLLSAAWIL
ncbi:hypothetical protein B0H17DRAFT_643852 [Mycena rosella]|uniref:Yeast cell wall synthesis Kre9/Knh1-like N-terminal domain-containing protein n=1 Tax=Mycena rosella TaxID=1033263 RepID=A0AAD7DDW1_MYCRO|nr:hypothetical protein B0H17DRAFT_643852 [Mycena rosella]